MTYDVFKPATLVTMINDCLDTIEAVRRTEALGIPCPYFNDVAVIKYEIGRMFEALVANVGYTAAMDMLK